MGSNDFISGDVFETNAFLSAGNGLSGVGEKIGTYYFLAGGGGGGSINDSYFLADGGYGGGGKGSCYLTLLRKHYIQTLMVYCLSLGRV